MFTVSHCDSRLVRSVSSPWSTNHHRMRLESGESLLVLRLTLRLDSTLQNLWITLFTVPTVQLLTVPQILRAPSTLALLLWAALLLAALLPGGAVPGALDVELGGLFELWCVGLDLFHASVTVGRRLVDLVLRSVATAPAYDFELIDVGWVAWSWTSEKAFFSCESSSFKASTVFFSSAIWAWLCSWPQVGKRKGSVLAVSSLCCSELTLAQQRCNHAWHFPSQKRASSLPSTMALLQTAQGSLFLLGGMVHFQTYVVLGI